MRVCEEYARRRRFSWAPKKCKVMGVLVEGELEVRLEGIVLGRVRSFKYLGVWMQEDGKWGDMIKCRGKKGKQRLAVLAGQWEGNKRWTIDEKRRIWELVGGRKWSMEVKYRERREEES